MKRLPEVVAARLARARRVAAVAARSGARFLRARCRCPRRIGKAMALKAMDPDSLTLARDHAARHCHDCADRCAHAVARIALDDVWHAGLEAALHSRLLPAAVARAASGGLEALGVAGAVAKAVFAAAWPHAP